MTTKLRLGPLVKPKSVKMTITLPAALHAELERYAALHSQLHGEKADAAALVPHMLDWFLKNDRGFRRQDR